MALAERKGKRDFDRGAAPQRFDLDRGLLFNQGLVDAGSLKKKSYQA